MEEITNLTVGQIMGGAVAIIAMLSIFIEITPVKINPISAFLRWLGKKLNAEVLNKVKGLDDKVSELDTKINQVRDADEEKGAIDCRVRILQFGDEVRRGIKHSQEHFDQILADMSAYDRYCAEHPNFKNEKTVLTSQRIRAVYTKCMEQDDFL